MLDIDKKGKTNDDVVLEYDNDEPEIQEEEEYVKK